jgi:hypothetical protein
MSWNYRVIRTEDEFTIHEVFYRDGKTVAGWTETPVYPRAKSAEDLRQEVARYTEALNSPVLNGDALESTQAESPGSQAYQCCICGRQVAAETAVELRLPSATQGGSQQIWAHGRCLRRVVHSSVPLRFTESDDRGEHSGG